MAKTFSLVFTGLSGSGKTTLAKQVTDELKKRGVHVQLIDGDDFRNELGNLFGYTREERMKHNRIARTLMRYLNRNNVNVIFTLVAPYEEMRQGMREAVGDAYIEVYAKCTPETCAKRDVKGYYKKQREGTWIQSMIRKRLAWERFFIICGNMVILNTNTLWRTISKTGKTICTVHTTGQLFSMHTGKRVKRLWTVLDIRAE